jgi:hypothetical protein
MRRSGCKLTVAVLLLVHCSSSVAICHELKFVAIFEAQRATVMSVSLKNQVNLYYPISSTPAELYRRARFSIRVMNREIILIRCVHFEHVARSPSFYSFQQLAGLINFSSLRPYPKHDFSFLRLLTSNIDTVPHIVYLHPFYIIIISNANVTQFRYQPQHRARQNPQNFKTDYFYFLICVTSKCCNLL